MSFLSLLSLTTLNTTNLYQQIIEEKNIQEAYLEVYESFIRKCTVYEYDVIDAQQIHQTELYLDQFLAEIRQDLIQQTPMRIALSIGIPKKNGKIRKIYMLPVKERVKCQAIYRILQNHLKPHYSKFLYSFRSERPSYYALRSLKRFYQANQNKGFYVLKTDFKDYSDYIDKNILIKKLSSLGADDQTLQLVRQFIEIPFLRQGELMAMSGGTMQGIPLVSLFNNIYMSQIDEKLGAESAFYRRVGDDVIALDQDVHKLEQFLKYIKSECVAMKIVLNEQKTQLQPLEEHVEYLGLAFEKGTVFIPHSKVKKIITELKLNFNSKSSLSNSAKFARLRQKLVVNKQGYSSVFKSIVNPHNLVTDTKYLQKLSLSIMKIIWAHLGGGYTGKLISRGQSKMKNHHFKLHSLFDHFAARIYSPDKE